MYLSDRCLVNSVDVSGKVGYRCWGKKTERGNDTESMMMMMMVQFVVSFLSVVVVVYYNLNFKYHPIGASC